MNTIRFIAALAMLLIYPVFHKQLKAQEAYAKGSLGYGLKWGSQNLPGFYNRTEGKVINREQIFVSLGKGFNAEGTFGYMLNNHLGGEMSISYLLGSKYTSRQESEDGSSEKEISAKMWRISPSVIVTADPDNTIIPFAKFGFIVGMGSSTLLATEYNSDNGDIEVYKQKLKGGIAFGIKAGVGASYVLSDKLSLFGEVNMISMSYGPKKAIITEATKNGEDILGDLTTRETEIEYVNDYVEKDDDEDSDDLPSISLREKLPFSSFGLNIGVRYSISY